MDYGPKVHESLEYIEKNLRNKINLDDLAEKAYLSKYHYHRLFHKIVGESVNSYINKRRMEAAAKELVLSDDRIIDIALRYQYSSQESFSRAFKREYQLAPGQYRRMFINRRPHHIVQLRSHINPIQAMAA